MDLLPVFHISDRIPFVLPPEKGRIKGLSKPGPSAVGSPGLFLWDELFLGSGPGNGTVRSLQVSAIAAFYAVAHADGRERMGKTSGYGSDIRGDHDRSLFRIKEFISGFMGPFLCGGQVIRFFSIS